MHARISPGDKEAVRHYLLNEPAEDMWNIQLDLEDPLLVVQDHGCIRA